MTGVVLVTGASGFAGSHLVELLTGQCELHAWTRSTPTAQAAPLAHWHTVDLMDAPAVRAAINEIRPTAIYHCAGSPHVASSWQDSATPLAQNVMGTHHLLDAIRQAGLQARVLITGSATVYASSPEPIPEHGTVAPGSPYALSKFAQERLGLRAVAEDGIDVVVARSFNHTGPRQTAAFAAPSMARQIALIERGEMPPVLKVGNLDARRDITDVRDVVRAYVALMTHGESAAIYNVSTGVAHSIRELLEGLLAQARTSITIETDPARMRPNDTPVLVGDCSRLKRVTGWSPQIPFDRMLADLLEYWRTSLPLL